MKSNLLGAVCAALFSFITVQANAALVSRLGGLAYYDDVAKLTWLANANVNGQMNWSDANNWATGLNVNGVTGWRLPTTLQPDSSCSGQSSISSSGFGCTGSEMGNMFYNVLGGVANNSIVDTHNGNYDLFTNLLGVDYVSSTVVSHDTTQAWHFDFPNGFQGIGPKTDPLYAWAVHSGDVGAVPVPAAVWLFGTGLIGLVGMARRKAT